MEIYFVYFLINGVYDMIEVVVIFSKYRVIELEERFCILFDEESLIVCLDLILN